MVKQLRSAKGADARRHTEKELREALGGEPETLLREFLERETDSPVPEERRLISL